MSPPVMGCVLADMRGFESGSTMRGFGDSYSAFDRFQQRHPSLGFPLAVLQKYADDQGIYLAATIAYSGFFAIFPLLLVLTTVLGFLLQGYPDLQQSIVDSALGAVPGDRPAGERRRARAARTSQRATAPADQGSPRVRPPPDCPHLSDSGGGSRNTF
jgi:hypothetical protein